MADSSDVQLTTAAVQVKFDEIMAKRSKLIVDSVDAIADSSWIKESMFADGLRFSVEDEAIRFYSSADRKFTDATMGGNYVINPRPQFTRYADPRKPGRLAGRNEQTLTNFMGNIGMGHYYSEAIDDTNQTIHMRFGVAEFNSLTGFFTSFYDVGASRYARSGRIIEDSIFHIFQAAGFVLSLVFWPIMAAHVIGVGLRFLMKKPASKFYYLRPTMLTYWEAVTTMVNQFAVYKGIFPQEDTPAPVGETVKMDATMLATFARMMPDVIRDNGFLDVYRIANRAQRISNKADQDLAEKINAGGFTEMVGGFIEQVKGIVQPTDGRSFMDAMKDWAGSWGKATVKVDGNGKEEDNLTSEKHIRTPEKPNSTEPNTVPDSFWQHLQAEFSDGSQFATFRVDHTGSVDESFSNSKKQSDLASKINGLSAQGRAASFSFAGGNIDDGILSGIAGAAKAAIEGTLSGLHLGGLLSLAGAAFVDMPDQWENSAANLPKMSYTMQLISPYANPMSQLMNIHLPMCMLLAAALPISTGKQSYTSPFLIELYDQGKAQTRLGLMESLSFVRGTSNLAFNKDKAYLSVDVAFTVVDLSSIMHMPLQSGFSLNPLKGLFDEDTAYTDYLHVLAANTLGQSVYPGQKFRQNLRNKYRTLQSMTSKARWAMFAHEIPVVSLIDIFYIDTSRK